MNDEPLNEVRRKYYERMSSAAVAVRVAAIAATLWVALHFVLALMQFAR